MRIWNTTEGTEKVREDVRLIHDLMSASFRSRGEHMPRILSVGTSETDADEHVYEVTVELAPDVVLRTVHGTIDDVDGDDGFPVWMASWAAKDTEASITFHLDVGLEKLSDLLHDMRLRCRKILARHAGDGGSGRLVDVQLTAEGFEKPLEIMVRIRLEGLDTQLRRMIDDVWIYDLETFDARIEKWSAGMSVRYAARRAFDAEGASGSIDMLTLAAVSSFADTRAWLRSLARSRWPRSPVDVTIFANDGAFRSQGSHALSGMSWNRDVIFLPAALPDTALAACKGRAVTDLIEHPMLSREMTIIDATNDVDGSDASVSVRITQPCLFFCTASGRTWLSGA